MLADTAETYCQLPKGHDGPHEVLGYVIPARSYDKVQAQTTPIPQPKRVVIGGVHDYQSWCHCDRCNQTRADFSSGKLRP
jgi:hypothetical protein